MIYNGLYILMKFKWGIECQLVT